MKIAYICADPGVPILGNKGASVHVREFTDALVELGHQVQIYAANGTAKAEANIDPNRTRAALTVLPPSENTRSTARIFASSLARLDSQHEHPHLFSEVQHAVADPEFINNALPSLRDFTPDLLIARHALFSTAGLTLARSLRCPCVLEVNAPLIEERRRFWGLTLEPEAEEVERAVFAGVDQLVAVSEGVRAYLLRYDAPADRIIVMDHENRGEWEGAFEASSRGPGWRFILKDISPGAYVVSAAFLGYLRTVETLKVVAGDTTKVTLRLACAHSNLCY